MQRAKPCGGARCSYKAVLSLLHTELTLCVVVWKEQNAADVLLTFRKLFHGSALDGQKEQLTDISFDAFILKGFELESTYVLQKTCGSGPLFIFSKCKEQPQRAALEASFPRLI